MKLFSKFLIIPVVFGLYVCYENNYDIVKIEKKNGK